MLKDKHDSIDEIPEQYRELYTERDGKWCCTGIAGIKTQDDIDRLKKALDSEKSDHKSTKEKLHVWDGMDHAEITTKLDRMAELEVAAGNKDEMDAKLEELTEARVRSRLAPVERENAALKKKLDEMTATAEKLEAERVRRVIGDHIEKACVEAKILQEAKPDVKMLAEAVFEITDDSNVLTRENPFGITPGLSPEVFLQEMQSTRPHWWPRTTGGDSRGSGDTSTFSKNPWSREHWNLTEQGKVLTTQGREKADQMAKSAGTVVGGTMPAAKK